LVICVEIFYIFANILRDICNIAMHLCKVHLECSRS